MIDREKHEIVVGLMDRALELMRVNRSERIADKTNKENVETFFQMVDCVVSAYETCMRDRLKNLRGSE